MTHHALEMIPTAMEMHQPHYARKSYRCGNDIAPDVNDSDGSGHDTALVLELHAVDTISNATVVDQDVGI